MYHGIMSAKVQVSHHIRALPPALKAMQAMGYSAGECLAGTGIEPGDLLEANPAPVLTLDQEFRFHRNLLRLSGDPLLGLRLGQAYSLQTYGLFGYAFMSAPTLRQALNIASNYGPLSFTLFRVAFRESASAGILQFSRLMDIPDDLFTYYVDRDVSAALAGADPDHIAPI
ncbi:MAG: AraC family transcriptional regulator ligand-binding domain-containing protein, partial [Halioglobus sp.]|nr:AraC family transcriptional regulator ligand-binding domain-containing protein [Halioglobus sp.]